MQAITAAAPQTLVSQLDFSLPSSAEYVRQRQQVTFNPSGGTTYGPGASNIIRFHLADGDAFLDPASVRLMYVVNNTSTNAAEILRPTSNVASCPFSRLTIKAGGQIVEDISSWNLTSNIMQQCFSPHILSEMEAEGFGGQTINPNGDSLRVSLKPLSGLLSQGKYLPLRYTSGITLEFTVADAAEWLNTGTGSGTAATSSASFSITQPEIKCDLVYIAGDLAEQYASYLLNSGPMPIVYSQYFVTSQAVSGTASSLTINLARSCSKLQSIFFVLQDDGDHVTKKATNMKSPGNEDFTFRVQVGSKRFPLQDVKGFAESRAKLAAAVGINNSNAHSLAMSAGEYRARKWIGAIDTELCAIGAHFTGQDTRAGDLLTVQLDGITPLTGNATIHVILLAQTILNVRDSGVDILD